MVISTSRRADERSERDLAMREHAVSEAISSTHRARVYPRQESEAVLTTRARLESNGQADEPGGTRSVGERLLERRTMGAVRAASPVQRQALRRGGRRAYAEVSVAAPITFTSRACTSTAGRVQDGRNAEASSHSASCSPQLIDPKTHKVVEMQSLPPRASCGRPFAWRASWSRTRRHAVDRRFVAQRGTPPSCTSLLGKGRTYITKERYRMPRKPQRVFKRDPLYANAQ